MPSDLCGLQNELSTAPRVQQGRYTYVQNNKLKNNGSSNIENTGLIARAREARLRKRKSTLSSPSVNEMTSKPKKRRKEECTQEVKLTSCALDFYENEVKPNADKMRRFCLPKKEIIFSKKVVGKNKSYQKNDRSNKPSSHFVPENINRTKYSPR